MGSATTETEDSISLTEDIDIFRATDHSFNAAYLQENFHDPDGENNRFADVEGLMTVWNNDVNYIYNAYLAEHKLGQVAWVDVGSGPTAYQFMAPSKLKQICDPMFNIYAAEYLTGNRNALFNWLKDTKEAHNWDNYLEYQLLLEGHTNPTPEAIAGLKKRVQSAIRHIYPCDVLQESPLGPFEGTFNVVSSHFVADSITTEEGTFLRAMDNIISLVADEGFLLISVLFEGNYYLVNGVRFPVFSITDTAYLAAVLSQKGFITINNTMVEASPPQAPMQYAAYQVILARRSSGNI